MEPWWASKLAAEEVAWWLSALDGERLSQLPGKQRVGLVNALGDLLRHLVRHLKDHWHSHCSRPDNDPLLGHATQSKAASSRQNNRKLLLAGVQGHRLALYLPAITAILVVLLDGAVKDLPQDTQQLLAAQAVTTPAAEPAASNKDGPAQLTADTEDAEAVSDEEEEESEGLAEASRAAAGLGSR